jgi:hypothetical protein
MKRAVLIAAIVVTACTSRDVALLPDGLWVSVHDANDDDSTRKDTGYVIVSA